MTGYLFRAFNVKQSTQQAGVKKIQFWLFNDPLVKIFMVRLEQKNNIAGFQNRYPGANSFII